MVIGIDRRVAVLGHPSDDRGLGYTMMELSPSWFRLLAAPGAGALALVAWLSSVTADSRGIPADLPIGELKTLQARLAAGRLHEIGARADHLHDRGVLCL